MPHTNQRILAKTVHLLRAFLPSWKFFDDLGDDGVLLYRTGTDQQALGDWQPAMSQLQRPWSWLFFNPEGNSRLAIQSLIQQFQAEINEWEDARPVEEIENQVSFQLIKNLIPILISKSGNLETFFQFKIRAGSDDLIISRTYPT